MQHNSVDYYESVQVDVNEDSEDGQVSDTSSSSPILSSYFTYGYKRLCDATATEYGNYGNDVIYRRNSSYMGHSRLCSENNDWRFLSSTFKLIHSRKVKRSVYLVGLASVLIIFTQLLTLYLDDSSLEVSISGWDRNRSRSTPFYILPNVNTTLIEPSSLCKDNVPILLLIVICSAAENFETRQLIRETWANSTEFNYSKFRQLHSHFKAKYLQINYVDWRNFVVKNSIKSTVNLNKRIIDNQNENPEQADFEIRTVFLVGQTENNQTQDQIIEESRTHNDLIQESFLDTYNNLTLKTVMMLKWINNNCAGKVEFVMKCDDDTFVNVPNLIHFLLGGTIPVYNATVRYYNSHTFRTLSPQNRLSHYEDLLIGTRFCQAKPVSDFRSKWFAPRYLYNKKLYPNYLSGAGYVFTMDTANKLYNVSMVTPLLHLEDVYLTGICAEKASIRPQNHQLFNYMSYKDLCEFRGMITIHEVKLSDIKKAYEFIMNTNVTCSPPSKRASLPSLKKTKKFCD